MNDITDIKKIAETQPEETQRVLRVVSPRRAEYGLAILSFLESSFVPIIIDPFLIAAVALHRERWHRYVVIATLSSVAGAIAAYFAGAFFWNMFGDALVAWLHAEQAFIDVQALVLKGSVVFTLIGALTPVPYKLTSLVGGLFHIAFIPFLVASLFGRYVRFLAVGYITYIGRTHAARILPHITWRRMFIAGFVLGGAAIAFLFR